MGYPSHAQSIDVGRLSVASALVPVILEPLSPDPPGIGVSLEEAQDLAVKCLHTLCLFRSVSEQISVMLAASRMPRATRYPALPAEPVASGKRTFLKLWSS